MLKKLSTIALLPFLLLGSIAIAEDNADTDTSASKVQQMYDELPDKYKVPGLVPVERISDFNINGWSDIDDRALIIEASVSKRYLVILRNRVPGMNFARAVAFDNGPDSYIRVGFDRLYVSGDGMGRVPHYIQAIFILDGREGAKQAKEYIENYDENTSDEATSEASADS